MSAEWQWLLDLVGSDEFAERFADAREVPDEFHQKFRKDLQVLKASLESAIERNDERWLNELREMLEDMK
jgi:hypothetical protein